MATNKTINQSIRFPSRTPSRVSARDAARNFRQGFRQEEAIQTLTRIMADHSPKHALRRGGAPGCAASEVLRCLGRCFPMRWLSVRLSGKNYVNSEQEQWLSRISLASGMSIIARLQTEQMLVQMLTQMLPRGHSYQAYVWPVNQIEPLFLQKRRECSAWAGVHSYLV